jgi:hypothetical protein
MGLSDEILTKIITQAERQVQFASEDSCGAIFVAEGR